MNSRIILYQNCQITQWSNFEVDSLSDYLEQIYNDATNYGGMTFENVQFFKHGLKTSIKIEMTQENLEYLEKVIVNIPPRPTRQIVPNFNYMKVDNGRNVTIPHVGPTWYGDTPVYYFITGKKWVSQNCIEFELQMDVLNTFQTIGTGAVTDIDEERTIIRREHKNRWYKKRIDENLWRYIPKIDFYSEGIFPTLYKKREQALYKYSAVLPATLDTDNYYLIYRAESTDENAPIHIWLVADSPLLVNQGDFGLTKKINPKKLGKKKGYIIYGADTYDGHNNVGAKIVFKGRSSTVHPSTDYEFAIASTSQAIIITRDLIGLCDVNANGSLALGVAMPRFPASNFKEATISGVFNVKVGEYDKCYHSLDSYISRYPEMTPTYISSCETDGDLHPVDENVYVDGIADIDRTDPKLLKIIKLPYCPIQARRNENTIDIDESDWSVVQHDGSYILEQRNVNVVENFDSGYMVMDTPNFDQDYHSPYTIIGERSISVFGNIGVAKSMDYETKLLHSDFYLQRLVYDSFYYDFKCEYIRPIDGIDEQLVMSMRTTSTMNSKFYFYFPYLTNKEGQERVFTDTQNYSGMIYVARNNEVPIYDSAYINYIKTGYNYDIKTKNRQLNTNIITSMATTIGAVASFTLAPATGGMSAIAGVGLATSSVSSYARLIAGALQNEQNIQQKLKTAEYQGLSVIGSDDVDLMTSYTDDNKLKLVEFTMTKRMKQYIYYLFYRYGYQVERVGLPRVRSRLYFDFFQADIVFLNQAHNIPEEILNEIVNKYKDGVTNIHKVVNGNENIWEFYFNKENWETNVELVTEQEEIV